MRELNKNIENDSLWCGRFYVHQIARQRYVYEDGSGMELWVTLEFVDRKTGRTKQLLETVNYWTSFCSRLFWEANTFIVEDVNVWAEDPRPGTPEWYDNMNWIKE
jgi:hypothetical protein